MKRKNISVLLLFLINIFFPAYVFGKIAEVDTVENATRDGLAAKIYFKDTDGDSTNIEEVQILIKEISPIRYYEDDDGNRKRIKQSILHCFDIDSLRVHNITEIRKNKPDVKIIKYYIVGSCENYRETYLVDKKGKHLKSLPELSGRSKNSKEEINISHSFYEYLKGLHSFKFPEIVTEISIDGDYNDMVDALYDF